MKPISQIFELVVEHIPGFPYPGDMSHYMNLENHWYNKYDGDLKKTIKKVSQMKQLMVHKLIFNDLIIYANNKVNKINTIDKYLKKVEIFKESKLKKLNEKDKLNKSNKSNKSNNKTTREYKNKLTSDSIIQNTNVINNTNNNIKNQNIKKIKKKERVIY